MMVMKNMKVQKQLLISFIAIFIINGSLELSYETQENYGMSLKKSLKQMILSISNVIKIYSIELDDDCENRTKILHGLAWECGRTERGAGLPPSKRANKFMKILQKFYGSLQQMQIDEARLNERKGLTINYKLMRAVRFLEYGLRNVTELQFRRFITMNIGPITVPYSLGSLPSRASNGTCIRIKHYYKLHMLRSCICDILKVEKWMHLLNGDDIDDIC